MKILWCWRCKMEVPMLDEAEFAIAHELYGKAIRDVKSHKEKEIRFAPLLDYYERVTGFRETEPNAIMHHNIAQYGPPCEKCSKPYRTPLAKFCASCGTKREGFN